MKEDKNESFSEEMDRLMKESEEREKNMSPEEKEKLKKARKRHQRKVRVEMLGYDKHPDEKKEDVFKENKRSKSEKRLD